MIKKINITSRTIRPLAVAFAVFLSTVICTLALASPVLADIVGKITTVEGTVNIARSDGSVIKDIRLWQEVSVGDIVNTKLASKAEITFLDDSVMRLAERSKLEIQEYLFSGSVRKSGTVKLIRGKARSIIRRNQKVSTGTFRISTPTAIAGVRGTDFFSLYNEKDEAATFLTKDGSVGVINPALCTGPANPESGSVADEGSCPDITPDNIGSIDDETKAKCGCVPTVVTEGNITTVAKGSPPLTPREATDAELFIFADDTDTGSDDRDSGAGVLGGAASSVAERNSDDSSLMVLAQLSSSGGGGGLDALAAITAGGGTPGPNGVGGNSYANLFQRFTNSAFLSPAPEINGPPGGGVVDVGAGGVVRGQLIWIGATNDDFDFHLNLPGGAGHIAYYNKTINFNGTCGAVPCATAELDHDNTGGYEDAIASGLTSIPDGTSISVENITIFGPDVPAGAYSFYVHNYCCGSNKSYELWLFGDNTTSPQIFTETITNTGPTHVINSDGGSFIPTP